MQFLIAETLDFTEVVYHYFGSDQGYNAFQNALLIKPDAGDVMQGTGGLRKLRWPDNRRGKGKRGGLRIIYLHLPEYQRLLLIDVYDKDEQSDLSALERKQLKKLVDDYKAVLAANRR